MKKAKRGWRPQLGSVGLAVAAWCVVGLVACDDAADRGRVGEPGKPAPAGAEVEEQLMALGYLDHVDGEQDVAARGVVHLEREAVSPGYTLTWLPRPCLAELIDLEGQVVHSWNLEGCKALNRAVLDPDGTLLVVGGLSLAEYSWDGEKRWERDLHANHDVVRTPDGGILILSAAYRMIPEWSAHQVRDNQVVHLSSEGEVLARLSLWDVTSENDIGFQLVPRNPKSPRSHRRRNRQGGYGEEPAARGELYIDLFHSNKVEWMSRPGLVGQRPLDALGNVLVTVRHQNAILAIDFARRELVWAWGQDELSGPHDGVILDDGKLLVFDNGLASKQSRVLEVDPRSGEIVWEYTGAPDREFFTASRGTAQRLPNGNTLVVVSAKGHAREVTRSGRVVWEYWNPHFDESGQRIAISRMRRYPESFVRPLLAGVVGEEGR